MVAHQFQGPAGNPVEEFQDFKTDAFSYLKSCVQLYGDIFQLPFSGEGDFAPTIVISHPEAIRFMNSTSTLSYFENKPVPAGDYLYGGNKHLLSLSKVSHQRLKKLMMPHFHGQALQAEAKQIWVLAEQLSQSWANEEPFWVVQAMQTLTLEVIVQIVFGITEGDQYQSLKYWTTEWLNWSALPEVGKAFYLEELRKGERADSPWGKHLYNLKKIDETLYGEICSRRLDPEKQRSDILSLLLATQDEQGNPLTDAEVRDNLLFNLFAGRDNTGVALSWALYELHRHPIVLEKLRQEIDSLDESLDLLKVAKLPYLTAVCKEILRLYSGGVLSLSRVIASPLDFMGYPLEVNACLAASFYLLHRREDLYPQPEQFRPERFLEREYGNHEFAPFGGGHRYCMGYALSQMEMKLALAAFLRRYQFKLVDSQPVKGVMKNLLTYPETDFQMRASA
jgi:cytochrome P450